MSKSNNNNNSRNKSKNTSHLNRKKRKLNKKKLVALVCFTMLFLFIAFKVTQGVVALVKGMDKSNKNNQQQNVESEQFDLGTEEENKNKKYTVFIDPGHGGHDNGTESKTSKEKDLTLQISKKLANKLAKQKDIQVVVSRTDDTYLTLMDRVNLANNSSADVLVSIHLNAEKNGHTATGIETWYRNKATDGSKDLAQSVQSTIVSYVKVRDRGIVENNFEVLRESKMPAILVECGFLTTPSEEQKIINAKYQDQLTEGIVQGILSYLDSKGKK